jgi:hypothetical protein
MSLIAILGDAIPRHLQKLSKTESKIMETLMTMKSGNAYSLWKQSKLKHYPTVLRTLRKLNEKNLVEILSKDGVRGETIYGLTVQGSFLFYILRNEGQELLSFLSSNSRVFQELHGVLRVMTDSVLQTRAWMLSIVRDVFRIEGGKKVSIDEVVKESVEGYVIDRVSSIGEEPEARKDLRMFSRVGWIKPLIIEETRSAIDSWKRHLEALIKFEKEMESAKE